MMTNLNTKLDHIMQEQNRGDSILNTALNTAALSEPPPSFLKGELEQYELEKRFLSKVTLSQACD